MHTNQQRKRGAAAPEGAIHVQATVAVRTLMTKRGGDGVVSVAHCSGPVWGCLPSHMPPPCPRTTPQSTSLSTNLYAKQPHHTVHVNLLKVQLTTQSVVAGGMNSISVGKHSQLHSIHIIKPSFLPTSHFKPPLPF